MRIGIATGGGKAIGISYFSLLIIGSTIFLAGRASQFYTKKIPGSF